MSETSICGFCGHEVLFEDAVEHISSHLDVMRTLKGAALRDAIEEVEIKKRERTQDKPKQEQRVEITHTFSQDELISFIQELLQCPKIYRIATKDSTLTLKINADPYFVNPTIFRYLERRRQDACATPDASSKV